MRERLQAKKEDIERRFNEVQERKVELERELYKLQGEYRFAVNLLEEIEKEEQNGSEPGRTEEPTEQS